MNTKRIEAIVQLIQTLPDVEQLALLDRLIQEQKVERVELKILALEQHLKMFEVQHQMSSGEFYRRFQAGELGDSAEFFEWNTYYETWTEARLQVA